MGLGLNLHDGRQSRWSIHVRAMNNEEGELNLLLVTDVDYEGQ
jgi:hypothetical protein